MTTSNRFIAIAVVAVVVAGSLPYSSSAQNVFDFSGRIFADYSYTVKSPDDELEGQNAFGYRRVYFTANYKQSDRFVGRIRLEANDKSTTAQGKPAPFVKDLYLKWKGALGEGHDITMGVSSPPSWEVSEKVWGYRSLIKSVQDRGMILSSRDMGIALEGQLTSDGKVRYGIMLANNKSVSRETDKHKRVYGQLEFYPAEKLSFTLGSDYASFEDGSAVNFNAFGGYDSGSLRFGLEAYLNPRSFDDSDHDLIRSGASLFIVARVSERISGILRIDRLEEDFSGIRVTESMLLAGFSFHSGPGVQIIPNIVIIDDSEDDDPTITGRVTLFVDIG